MKATYSEAEFMAQVIQLANLFGWLSFHVHDSRRSAPGFPDCVFIRGPVLIVAELKVGKRKPTPEQLLWLEAFRGTGAKAFVWYPSDFPEIQRVLQYVE